MQFIPIPSMGVGGDVLMKGMKGKPMRNDVLIYLLLPKGLMGQVSQMFDALAGHPFKGGDPLEERMRSHLRFLNKGLLSRVLGGWVSSPNNAVNMVGHHHPMVKVKVGTLLERGLPFICN